MYTENQTLAIEIVYHTSVRTRVDIEPFGAHKMLDDYWSNPFDIYYVRNEFYRKRIFMDNIVFETYYVDGNITVILLLLYTE